MIDVNIKGVLYGIAEVIPVMKEQNGGHIINIASIAGHRVIPSSAVYSGTKYAVRAISEGFRQELSNQFGIRMTLISPGMVETELTDHITDEDVIDMIKNRKLTGLQADDIAQAILHVVNLPVHVNVNEYLVMPTEQR